MFRRSLPAVLCRDTKLNTRIVKDRQTVLVLHPDGEKFAVTL